MKINVERKLVLGLPTILMLNKYIKEMTCHNRTNRNFVVQTYHPVEQKELPGHLGNKINILI